MPNNVALVILKFSTQRFSWNLVKRNLENHVVLLGFTQSPKSSNNTLKPNKILYSCKAIRKSTYLDSNVYRVLTMLLSNSKNVKLIWSTSTIDSCIILPSNIIELIKNIRAWSSIAIWPLQQIQQKNSKHMNFFRQQQCRKNQKNKSNRL